MRSYILVQNKSELINFVWVMIKSMFLISKIIYKFDISLFTLETYTIRDSNEIILVESKFLNHKFYIIDI